LPWQTFSLHSVLFSPNGWLRLPVLFLGSYSLLHAIFFPFSPFCFAERHTAGTKVGAQVSPFCSLPTPETSPHSAAFRPKLISLPPPVGREKVVCPACKRMSVKTFFRAASCRISLSLLTAFQRSSLSRGSRDFPPPPVPVYVSLWMYGFLLAVLLTMFPNVLCLMFSFVLFG